MKILILILVIGANAQLLSQSYKDTIYNVELTGTTCLLISFFSDERYPESNKYNSMGGGLIVRGMWHPGRLLSVGILTGYIILANDKIDYPTNVSAQLSAIPLQVALAMQKSELEMGVGLGSYLLISKIDNGIVARSVRSELAMTVFGSYFFNLSKNFVFGPVVKVNYLSYRGVLSILPSVNIRYILSRY